MGEKTTNEKWKILGLPKYGKYPPFVTQARIVTKGAGAGLALAPYILPRFMPCAFSRGHAVSNSYKYSTKTSALFCAFCYFAFRLPFSVQLHKNRRFILCNMLFPIAWQYALFSYYKRKRKICFSLACVLPCFPLFYHCMMKIHHAAGPFPSK